MPANNPNPCRVDSCGARVECRGLCRKHYSRWRRHGDPLALVGHGGPGSLAAVVSYEGLHQRLRRVSGRASDRDCVSCGQQARTWAYDHSDPNEVRDSRGRPYSHDLSRYQPMCSPCHTLFDLAESRGRG